jgi:hypothetical protein
LIVFLFACWSLELGPFVPLTDQEVGDDTALIRTTDPYLHHALRPGVTGKLSFFERYFVPYSINSLGFRDRAPRTIDPQFKPGKRVVILGDSFAEGYGVKYERSAAAVLEKGLSTDDHPVEVLNGGVASYSPFLYFRRLKQFFDRGFRADEVVVFLDISDIQDEGAGKYHEMSDDTEFRTVLPDLFRFFFQRSNRRRFWETAFFDSLPQRKNYYKVRGEWTEDDKLFQEYGMRGVERCKSGLLKVRDLASRFGADFRLVIYPWKRQLESMRQPPISETLFMEFAAQNDIRLTNLYNDFRSVDWSVYFLPDNHWNFRGNRLVGEAVAREVRVDLGLGTNQAIPNRIARSHR